MDQDTRTPALTIGALLSDCAARYGERAAIRFMENGASQDKSYRTLFDDSLRAAAELRRRFPRGGHIVITGHTSYAYLVWLNAIFISGCTAVPVGFDEPPAEKRRLLLDSDADGVLYAPKCFDPAAARDDCARVRFCEAIDAADFAALPDAPADWPSWELPERCSAIIYTSGTTGTRKGAMLSSAALVSNVYFREMDFEGGHVALNVLPMHHIFSFSCDYLKNLKDGVTICLNSSLAALGKELLCWEPTVLRLVPVIADSLLRRVRLLRRREPELTPREAAERVFGRRLRNIIVSGASYTAANDREFAEMGITIRQGYGMTETGPRIAVPDGGTCAASGGRIISICQVRLVDGEIQVRSPSLMIGYYKRPEETAAVFTPDGWFRTGDLGRVTPDRELFIVGRCKNVIILPNGENVSPEELERKYAADPLIREIEVYEDQGEIACDVYPDYDYARKTGVADLEAAVRALVAAKNASDTAAREIDRVKIRQTPLEKTNTGKIKRRRWNP